MWQAFESSALFSLELATTASSPMGTAGQSWVGITEHMPTVCTSEHPKRRTVAQVAQDHYLSWLTLSLLDITINRPLGPWCIWIMAMVVIFYC
jgi:hypothetical protein